MPNVRRRFVVSSFALLVGAGFGAGCGDDGGNDGGGGGAGPGGGVTYSVPEGGGSVDVKTASGNVLTFEFPASAAGKTLTLTPSTATSIGWGKQFDDVIRMEPDGTQFADPVRVKPSKKNLLLLSFPNQASKSAGEGLPLAASGDALELSHFSTLVVVPPGSSCNTNSGWEVINGAVECQAFGAKSTYVGFGCTDHAYCLKINAHCCALPGSTECQLGDADLFLQYQTGTGPSYCGPSDAGTDGPNCAIDTGGNLCGSCAVTKQVCCAEISGCYQDTQCKSAFWQWASCNTGGGGLACFGGLQSSGGPGAAVAACLQASGCSQCTTSSDAGTGGTGGVGGTGGIGGIDGGSGTGGAGASGGTGATGGSGGTGATGGSGGTGSTSGGGGTGATGGSGGTGATGGSGGTGATGGSGGTGATGGSGGTGATGGSGGTGGTGATGGTGGTGGGAGSATKISGPEVELEDLAIDATNAYLVNSAGEVRKVPLSGGSSVVLASNEYQPASVTVDATHVYWVSKTFSNVRRIPIGGGTPSTVASGLSSPVALAMDSTNVYITEAGNSRVVSVPKAGGTVTPLASNLAGPNNLTIDGSTLFFTTATATGKSNPRSVLGLPTSGGTPTSLYASTASPGPLAAAGGFVYFADTATNFVRKVQATGGPPADVSAGGSVADLAVDGSNFYWADYSSVKRAPVGGGTSTTLVSGLSNARAVVLDATHFYFIQMGPNGGVFKQTK